MGSSRKGKHRKGKGKSKPVKPDIAMDGSRKGKQLKDEGKSEPNKSDTLGEELKAISPMLDSEQTSISKIPAPSRSLRLECELERFLRVKIKEIYNTSRDFLLALGYGILEVEKAILNVGYVRGHTGFLSNVVTNCIDFIEKELNPEKQAFKNTDELYKAVFEALVDCVMQAHPDMQRSGAMWHLVVSKWDHVLSSSDLPSGNLISKSEDDGAALEAFTAARCIYDLSSRREICAPDIISEEELNISSYEAWLELSRNYEDPKNGVIVDLVKEIKDLEEQVQEHKERAPKEDMDSIIMPWADSLELQQLRIEKVARERRKKEENYMDLSLMLKHLQTEVSLRKANCKASFVNAAVARMELENGKIRAEIESCKLNASESERELKIVEKREKGCSKRAADVEKQTGVLISQCEEGNKRVMEMEQELLKVEKETEETEKKWRQEIKVKEETLALVAQETKKTETQKYRSKIQLSKLRQQVATDRQVLDDRRRTLEDELSRLRMPRPIEDELSRLRISRPVDDSLPEKSDILYKNDEAASSSESKGHWICMLCKQREVSVVCLPCTHQVLCFPCNEKVCKAVGARCPYCRIRIEKSIKVHGFSS